MQTASIHAVVDAAEVSTLPYVAQSVNVVHVGTAMQKKAPKFKANGKDVKVMRSSACEHSTVTHNPRQTGTADREHATFDTALLFRAIPGR